MDIGELVRDGQLLVASLIALLAGLISFLSPCVLPLVPGYLAYVSASADASARHPAAADASSRHPARSPQGGVAGSRPDGMDPATSRRMTNGSRSMTDGSRRMTDRARMVIGSLLFVLGFTAVFVVILVAAGTVGVWLVEWEDVIMRVMGVVLILMGLVFVGLFGGMQVSKKMKFKPRLGLAGAPLLGAVFAVGWTPCMGPTLAVIMGLSLQQGSVGRSVVLAIFYCLGLGLPFVLAAFGFGWMTETMTFFKRHIRAVNLIGGGLLILIGILMVTGLWSRMMYAFQAVIGGYVTPL